jgi:hypothetical protein
MKINSYKHGTLIADFLIPKSKIDVWSQTTTGAY